MTITNGYCTLAEFKAYVTSPGSTISTDSADDAVIEQLIEAVSRYIDRETGRTFYARTATARLQSVPDNGARTLRLDDDLISIDAGGLINGDGTAIASTEYKLIPLNDTPKHAIRLNDSSTVEWAINSAGDSVGVISVTGSWGFSATAPHDIRLACMSISKALYNRRFGENQSSESIITPGGVVITPRDISSSTWAIIRQYRRWV